MICSKVKLLVIIFLLIGMFSFIAGCSTKKSSPDIVILTLFDISGSTLSKSVRERYRQDFEKVTQGVVNSSRDIVLISGKITENTEATAGELVQQHFAAFGGFTSDNVMKAKQKRQSAQKESLSGANNLIKGTASKSDIMSGFLYAGKVFAGYPETKHKILLIFSDMIEQTGQYEFTAEHLTQKRIQEIIEHERKSGRLPQLQGVRIWVIGEAESEKGGLPPIKITEIENFWLAYCKAAGADLDTGRYNSRLLNFELPEK